jgi:hypothetical protein
MGGFTKDSCSNKTSFWSLRSPSNTSPEATQQRESFPCPHSVRKCGPSAPITNVEIRLASEQQRKHVVVAMLGRNTRSRRAKPASFVHSRIGSQENVDNLFSARIRQRRRERVAPTGAASARWHQPNHAKSTTRQPMNRRSKSLEQTPQELICDSTEHRAKRWRVSVELNPSMFMFQFF